MGIHTQTRPVIVNAIWQYIKVRKLKKNNTWGDTNHAWSSFFMLKVDKLFLFIDMCCAHFLQSHNLQDSHEREYINCDRYFQQVRKKLAYRKVISLCKWGKFTFAMQWENCKSESFFLRKAKSCDLWDVIEPKTEKEEGGLLVSLLCRLSAQPSQV